MQGPARAAHGNDVLCTWPWFQGHVLLEAEELLPPRSQCTQGPQLLAPLGSIGSLPGHSTVPSYPGLKLEAPSSSGSPLLPN